MRTYLTVCAILTTYDVLAGLTTNYFDNLFRRFKSKTLLIVFCVVYLTTLWLAFPLRVFILLYL